MITKINNWKKTGMIGFVLVLILTACSGANTGGKVLNVARDVSPSTVNYLMSETVENAQIISNFSEGLTTYDKDGKLVPGLAREWTHDGPVYTFTLKDNLKWSNEAPITAHDFAFGWKTLMGLAEAPYKFLMSDIENGQAIIDGQKSADELGVRAIDDATFEVRFISDRVYLLEMLAHMTFLPLNEAFYNSVGSDQYGTSPETLLASGPFTLTEYNPSSHYTLVKNPNYWNATQVQLDKVNTRVIPESSTQEALFSNGELDWLDVKSNLYDKYQNDGRMVNVTSATSFHIYLSGNTLTSSPALANADFRQALNYAIDKEVLTQQVLKNGSIPLEYLIPQKFGNVNGTSYRQFTGFGNGQDLRFNVDKAREYLARAKAALGQEEITITMAYGEAETNRHMFANIQSQLQTNLPGVTVNLNAIPTSTYFAGLAKGDTPSAFSGWSPDYNDVASFFQTFITGNSMNYGRYSNPRYDALYAQAQEELDAERRARLFAEAEEILINDGAMLPLFQRGKRYLVADKVKGFNFNSISPEMDFRYISVS